MYLIDTNVFIEGLLGQEKAGLVTSFFQKINLKEIFITDLSLHSIGIILYRLGKHDLFEKFLKDLFDDGMDVLSLGAGELKKCIKLPECISLILMMLINIQWRKNITYNSLVSTSTSIRPNWVEKSQTK